jgi:hypothetical protein
MEITMPILPSGRRVELSLDRFHALLSRMDRRQARALAENMDDPDDLLFVLDAVHFSLEDGTPFFADYVASDWMAYAADWSATDRQALQTWLTSAEARFSRAEAISYIKTLLLDRPCGPVAYPYVITRDVRHSITHEGSRLRQ